MPGLFRHPPQPFWRRPTAAPPNPPPPTDTFSRTVVNGLGDADAGGTYTITGTAGDFDVGGGVGTVITAAAGGAGEKLAELRSVSSLDLVERIGWTIPAPAGAGSKIYFASRAIASGLKQGSYSLQVVVEVGGAISLLLERWNAGSTVVITASTPVSRETHTGGTKFWVELSAVGTSPTSLEGRIWQDGTGRPSAPDISGSDSTAALQVAGGVGMRLNANSGATVPYTNTLDDWQTILAESGSPVAGVASGVGTAHNAFAHGPIGTYVTEVLADSPVAYYRLGESSGTVAVDEMAAFDGVIEGTPTLGATSLLTSDPADTAIALNGTTAQRVTADELAQRASGNWHDWSMEVWVKFDQDVNEEHVVAFSAVNGDYRPAIFRDESTNNIAHRDNSGGDPNSRMESDAPAVTGTTYHIVVTRTGTGANDGVGVLYVNGVAQADTGTGLKVLPTVNGLFTIGGEYDVAGPPPTPTSPVDGTIDEVAVYETVLSPERVLAHYIAGTSEPAGVEAAAGVASGTGAASGVTTTVAPVVPVSTGTGAAQSATTSVKPTAGAASGTGAAQSATTTVATTVGQATGTGTASAPSASVAPVVGAAAGTGAAFDATVTTGTQTNAAAGVATGTGAANAPSPHVAPVVGAAAGTGSALDATVTTSGAVTADAGVAAGTGAAANASTSVKVTAGYATGTGAAHNATVSTAAFTNAQAGVATGTGTVHGASTSLAPRVNAASGTGAAHNAAAIAGTGVYHGTAPRITSAGGASTTGQAGASPTRGSAGSSKPELVEVG